MKFSVSVITLLFIAGSCAPPANWKEHSRLFGPEIKRTEREMKDQKSVRVLIYQGSLVSIQTDSPYEYTDINSQVKKGNGAFLPKSPGKLVTEKGEFNIKGQVYFGDLVIMEDSGKYSYVNVVPLNEYLVSVVGHEMSPAWPLEALKAQAVVARTYVMQKMTDSREKLYDIGNTTKDQVYTGKLEKDQTVREAIKETRLQVITYKGELANVFFHSSCGGKTASAAEVWQEDLPYLPSKTCSFKESPEYNWEVVYAKSIIEQKLGIKGIQKIGIKERTESKRVKTLIIESSSGKIEMQANDFRNKLGPEKVKSTLFGLRFNSGVLTIRGHGYGHGVGLCQWCAKIMVEKRSMKYASIIRYFFPGTRIKRM